MAAQSVINALTAALPTTQIHTPGSDEYTQLNNSYLSGLESDLHPAAILRPRSVDEVSKFLRTIKPFVDCGEVQFAIRGGGQQPARGCANIDGGGITLDLGLISDIELHNDKNSNKIVSIGAGARWGAVYKKLDGTGLGVTGVRSSRGGIGGLALTGGHSFFSSREGFVCDNVVNYEVVLTSGAVVNANANDNSDLWIALRGGGNNFGVVTRFDFRTFPQGRFWGGAVYYFANSFPGQIDALVAEVRKENPDEETHLMLSLGYAAAFGQNMCMNQTYYTKEVEKPAALEPFVAMQPQLDALNTMRMMSIKEAAEEQAASGSDGVRAIYMTTTVKVDAETLKAGVEIYTAALEPVKPIEGLINSYTLQPYPVSCLKKSIELGGNSLGLNPEDGPLVNIALLGFWKNKTDDETIMGFMRSTIEAIQKMAEKKGTAVPYTFMNYSDTFQDPIASYGEENKKKLQAVSGKYDPDGVFQKGVPGGWKLF